MNKLIENIEDAVKFYEKQRNMQLHRSKEESEQLELDFKDSSLFPQSYIDALIKYQLNEFQISFIRFGLKSPRYSILETYTLFDQSLDVPLKEKNYVQFGARDSACILFNKDNYKVYFYDGEVDNDFIPELIADSFIEFVSIVINLFKESKEGNLNNLSNIVKEINPEMVNQSFWKYLIEDFKE